MPHIRFSSNKIEFLFSSTWTNRQTKISIFLICQEELILFDSPKSDRVDSGQSFPEIILNPT